MMERCKEIKYNIIRGNTVEMHSVSEMGFYSYVLKMNLFHSCKFDSLLQFCKNMTILEDYDYAGVLEEIDWIFMNILVCFGYYDDR